MAAKIYSGSGNFTYTNDTGNNVRLIVNQCYSQTTTNTLGWVEWGSYTNAASSLELRETQNTNSCFTQFKVPDHQWGRNSPKYTDLHSYDIDGGGVANGPENATTQISGVPCEYFLANGHKFTLQAFNEDSANKIKSYNIMVIPGSAGQIFNGRGNFSYTNSTGGNVRVSLCYIHGYDASTPASNIAFSWGSSADPANGTLTQDTSDNGYGKYSINRNAYSCTPMNTLDEVPVEFWLSSGEFFSCQPESSATTIDGYSFLVMPEAG